MDKLWRSNRIRLGFLVLILAVPVIYFLTRPSHTELFLEPTPNGYRDFIKAIDVGSFDNRVFEPEEPIMRAVVAENQAAIGHVLAGLEKNCQVKFEPDLQKHAAILSGFSSLT